MSWEQNSKRSKGCFVRKVLLGGGAVGRDWWMLGVFVYQMLVGTFPWTGRNPREVHTQVPAFPHRARRGGVAHELGELPHRLFRVRVRFSPHHNPGNGGGVDVGFFFAARPAVFLFSAPKAELQGLVG